VIELGKIAQSVVDMDIDGTENLTREAVAGNIPVADILNNGLVAGIQIVGERFGRREIFLPELLMSGEAMKAAMKVLKPLLTKQESGQGYVGRAAIGTVQGDIHDIGKNILLMMLEGNGWEVTDLGIDVSPEKFCAVVRDNDYHILGLSALLTTTMPNQKRTIEALKASGLRNKVKVAIGGAAVSQAYADQIGADCYANNAFEAVKKFKMLVS
jgi:5-methyltetrahydrofolate--homocysteine methyltransferase